MRLPDDDDIYEVDQTYLGPPGKYIGRFRYRALALFPGVFFPALVVVRQVVHPGFFILAWTVVLSSFATKEIVDRTTQERALTSLFLTWWHELTAPRRPPRGSSAHFNPRRLSVRSRSKETPSEAA